MRVEVSCTSFNIHMHMPFIIYMNICLCFNLLMCITLKPTSERWAYQKVISNDLFIL